MPEEKDTAIHDEIRGSLLAPPDKVDLESIALQFVKMAGGTAAIAKLLYDEYGAAGEGSPVRARIMEMILRAFTKLDAKALPDDLRDVSDEDLERVMDASASRISRKRNGHQRSPAAAKTPQEVHKQAGAEEGGAAASPGPDAGPADAAAAETA